MDDATKLADQIVSIKEGEIVQFNTPDEILHNPANPFSEDFIGKDCLIQAQPNVTQSKADHEFYPGFDHSRKSLQQAVQKMKEKRINTLLIADEKNILHGFIDVEQINYRRKTVRTILDILERNVFMSKKSLCFVI